MTIKNTTLLAIVLMLFGCGKLANAALLSSGITGSAVSYLAWAAAPALPAHHAKHVVTPAISHAHNKLANLQNPFSKTRRVTAYHSTVHNSQHSLVTVTPHRRLRHRQKAVPIGYSFLAMHNPPILSPYLARPYPHPSVFFRSSISNTDKEIDLTLGKANIINLPMPASRISISDPNIAQAVVISPTQLQLVGKKVGVTNLYVWEHLGDARPKAYDIGVHRDVSLLTKQLQKLDPGINIMPMAAEDSVILTGEVDSPETAQLAMEVAKAFFGGSSSGSGSAAGGGGSVGAAAGVGGGSATGGDPSSQAPGSALASKTGPNVLNLIKIKGRPSTKLELVRQKLQKIDPNITLDIVPGLGGSEKAILTGKVRTAGMVSKAINTASIFYGQPGLKVVTGPGGNLIRSTGSGGFQGSGAFSDNVDINILQGSVVTDASGNVISMMEVQERPQVRCKIKFLDVSRRDMRQLGATLNAQQKNWGGSSLSGIQGAIRPLADVNGDRSGTSYGVTQSGTPNAFRSAGGTTLSDAGQLTQTFRNGVTQVFTIGQNYTTALSAFIEKKHIKSLAEPTLTMLSGEKASFLAGGEIPIPISAANGQINVSFHEFGIRLNLIPTVTDDGKIHMQIAPEVSQVDPGNSIVANNITIPGFKTRRMQTTLELDNQQSFVLAGLFDKEFTDTVSKLPGAGDVPIIGALFRQKNRDNQDNEMVVIVQPEIIMSSDKADNK